MYKGKLAFYISAGFGSMIVIPSLFIMAATFAICGIFLIGYTLDALFIDLPNIINIGPMILTGISAFFAATITGGILLVLAFICRNTFRKYLYSVSARYHQLHPERISFL